MSEQEINIAIAEACGWHRDGCEFDRARWKRGTMTMVGDFAFTSDLNAMHEVEKRLIFSERKLFRYCLQKVKGSEIEDGVLIALDECVHATAKQRAEAFLRTIGKWEEAAK